MLFFSGQSLLCEILYFSVIDDELFVTASNKVIEFRRFEATCRLQELGIPEEEILNPSK